MSSVETRNHTNAGCRGTSSRAVQLINLATVNYILWGLQVGSNLPGGGRWKLFFDQLCHMELAPYRGRQLPVDVVFNFIRSYIMPFGVLHGADTQGGLHEGNDDPFVQGSDYVGAFAVEGKLHNVMNLWRCCDVYEVPKSYTPQSHPLVPPFVSPQRHLLRQDDDLVFELREMKPKATSLHFNLSSSVRAQRTERCNVPRAWFYLEPAVLKYKSIADVPHIHIGRSQKMINAYTQNRFGLDLPPWNARACVLGLPLVMTFEPCFRASDSMLMATYAGEEDDEPSHLPEVSSIAAVPGAPEGIAVAVLPDPASVFRAPADATVVKKRKRADAAGAPVA